MKEFKTSIPCTIRTKGKIVTELEDKIHWDPEHLECAWQDDNGHWHLIEFDSEDEYKKHKFEKTLKGK